MVSCYSVALISVAPGESGRADEDVSRCIFGTENADGRTWSYSLVDACFLVAICPRCLAEGIYYPGKDMRRCTFRGSEKSGMSLEWTLTCETPGLIVVSW